MAVFWKQKKLEESKKFSALIRVFEKNEQKRYQFVINTRYRGLHLWHSKLHDDLVACAFEGFQKILEAEEDPYKAFSWKPTKQDDDEFNSREESARARAERLARQALGKQ